ncbi:hypothetical protein niasHT_000787 [Heterodera trifolii]|uniref:TFIIS N-terminal domain-containing protein n=1 Tax=Heterodera trifolii TaxID=157864 RepID=A0ABD2LQY6_9BILA
MEDSQHNITEQSVSVPTTERDEYEDLSKLVNSISKDECVEQEGAKKGSDEEDVGDEGAEKEDGDGVEKEGADEEGVQGEGVEEGDEEGVQREGVEKEDGDGVEKEESDEEDVGDEGAEKEDGDGVEKQGGDEEGVQGEGVEKEGGDEEGVQGEGVEKEGGDEEGVQGEGVEKEGVEEEGVEGTSKQGEVSQLMQDIFGDNEVSEDEEDKDKKAEFEDEDEPKLIRVEPAEEDVEQDSLGRTWDFDVMLAKKKQERRRRRRKDGSIDLMADADDQIRELVEAMNEAANEDRMSNMDRRPAVKKRKMLQVVKNTLLKTDLFEAMLDNGMISALSEWLAPLPDKSLPALEIRCTLLKILENWPNLEQSILKQSGLGRAVMYLFKHPKETKENKLIAAKLIREWSRPIFQLDSDFRSLSKEERVQRDYSQMPLAKKRRLSMDNDEGIFAAAQKQQKQQKEETKQPGEVGFMPRARVPRPSTCDYVIRPKPEIEGQFRGETKNKQKSRFSKMQREMRSQKTTKRAVGVSINKDAF